MNIELFSFVFGVVIALAVVIVVEHIYGKIFGNRKLRELEREIGRLRRIVQKKDELIRKSLKEIEQREKTHDG